MIFFSFSSSFREIVFPIPKLVRHDLPDPNGLRVGELREVQLYFRCGFELNSSHLLHFIAFCQ